MCEISTNEVIAWAKDIERQQGTDMQAPNRACAIATAICDTLSDSYDAPRHTHQAVVDEYGEIVYARRICATIDAEAQCRHYIKLCDKDPVTRAHVNNWTIKGVTVNE